MPEDKQRKRDAIVSLLRDVLEADDTEIARLLKEQGLEEETASERARLIDGINYDIREHVVAIQEHIEELEKLGAQPQFVVRIVEVPTI